MILLHNNFQYQTAVTPSLIWLLLISYTVCTDSIWVV